jgi:hypothetical protein
MLQSLRYNGIQYQIAISYSKWSGLPSGRTREEFTLALLAKFQKKLSSAKERDQEKSDDKVNHSSSNSEDKTKEENDDDW